MEIEVWVIPGSKTVLVTDLPGPPASICGFVSEEARQAAEARGYATASEIGFLRRNYLGKFDSYQDALDQAKLKAEELGFSVKEEIDYAYL